MRLLVLLLVCALAVAENHEKWATPEQVTVALGHLYRRFLHAVSPKQLQLQDALEMHYRKGMMANKPFTSAVSFIPMLKPSCIHLEISLKWF